MISANIRAADPQSLVTIWATPDDLRKLADAAEKFWREAKLGGDLCFYTIGVERLVVRMVIDQPGMRKLETGE